MFKYYLDLIYLKAVKLYDALLHQAIYHYHDPMLGGFTGRQEIFGWQAVQQEIAVCTLKVGNILGDRQHGRKYLKVNRQAEIFVWQAAKRNSYQLNGKQIVGVNGLNIIGTSKSMLAADPDFAMGNIFTLGMDCFGNFLYKTIFFIIYCRIF